MTNIPPSWQSNQPPQVSPGSPQQQLEEEQQPRMVRVRRTTQRPTVTYTIMGITVLFYVLQEAVAAGILVEPFIAMGEMMFGAQAFQQLYNTPLGGDLLVLLFGKISPLIEIGQFWRLLTPALLHASLMHIGFNMYALFSLGPIIESYYGHGRFLALYLLGALGGNVLSFLMNPGWTPSVGASTAIFGLIAAWGVFIYQNRSIFGSQARAMLTNVVVIVLINLAFGLSSSGIDNWGHLGGLLAGLAFGWFAGPRLEVTYRYPDYELVDQRSPTNAWTVGILLAVLLMGMVLLSISRS